jgi:AraC family transcriptional regulator
LPITEPIKWQELINWVPGRILRSSESLGWTDVGLRSYRYRGQKAEVPALQDFMLVTYHSGPMSLRRSFGGKWRDSVLDTGSTSLLTRAQSSVWDWTKTVDVTHVYLSRSLVNKVAGEVLDRAVGDVELADLLRVDDHQVRGAVTALVGEASQGGLGGALYVDVLSRSLIIHLLRRYATVQSDAVAPTGELSAGQRRTIEEFIRANLSVSLDLDTMAGQVGLPAWAFSRQFKKSFSQPPYAYVIERRVDMARHLLKTSDLPLSDIAAHCGFADQAHMTRLFRRCFAMPPGEYRRHLRS